MLYCVLLFLIPMPTATLTAYIHTLIPYCYPIIPFPILIPTSYFPLHIPTTGHCRHCYIYCFSTHTSSLPTYHNATPWLFHHPLLLTVHCYCPASSLLPPLLLSTHTYSSVLPDSASPYPYSPLPIPYGALLMPPSPHCYQHLHLSTHLFLIAIITLPFHVLIPPCMLLNLTPPSMLVPF